MRNRLSIAQKRRTDRRRQPTAPQAATLSRILMASDQPFGQAFPDGRIGLHNQAMLDLTGYDEAEFSRLNWHTDLTAPEWRESERINQTELHRTGSVISEQEYLHKDGHRIPVEIRAHLVRAASGEPDYYYAFVTDISQRRRDMAKLDLLARRAESMLDLADAADRMDEAEFMQYGMELAEKLTESQIAFIHFVNDDQLTIELVAWSRRTLEHYCKAAFDSHYPIDQAGIWADAMRQKRAVVFNDYASAEGKHGLPEGHAALARLISVPVMEGGKVRMMAGVGNRTSPYLDLDVETVQLIANEIWHIVQRRRSQRQTARFSQAMENSINEIYLFECDSLRFVEVNRGAIDNIGYSRDELFRMTPLDLKPEFDRASFTELIRPLIDGAVGILRLTTVHRRKDGSRYPVEIGIELTRDQPPLALATVLDISQRKDMEKSLRESESRYRSLFENNMDAVLLTSPDGTILAANPEAERLFGKTEAELRQAGRGGVIDPNDPRLPAALAERARNGRFRGELRLIDREGKYFPAELTSLVFRDRDGRMLTSMIVRDITGRLAAEQQLRQLSQAVEQSPASIVITDLDANIVYANPAFSRISGYAGEEVLDKNPRILHSGKTPTETYRELWATLSRGETWRGQFINRRKDGSEYTELAVISPVRQADGQISHYLAIKQDITDQQRTEQELSSYRQHLEDMVELRTRELENARREAESLAKVKSEFLANMSHEIRTPLNAVLGFAQIGLRDSHGRKAAETFERILDSGQLLLGVVNDILDFSKIDAGKLELEQGVVDLREVIDRAAALVRERAREKGLAFRVGAAADLPATCRGDGLRLTQVLGNLLTNAIKFTDHGAVTLTASRTPDSLVFRITDTGIGMGPEQVARLFNAFEQADSSTTRKYGGTGLGLTITKRLLDMMGGSVRVDSQPGEGSTFEARVPLAGAEGQLGNRSGTASADGATPAPAADLTGLNILVAEDNAVNRLVLEEMLRGQGCQLDQVENGLLALDRVRQHGPRHYDLVLMDVQMPVMDGYDATRRLRALAPDLPVIGLTAHALPEDHDKCLAAGMVEHLAKPIGLTDLLDAIQRHTGRSTGPAAPGSERTAPVPPAGTLVDWPAALARYAGREDFLARLVDTLSETLTGRPEHIRQLVAGRVYDELAFVAHSLKGVAGDIIPDDLRERARLTEHAARAKDPGGIAIAMQLAEGLAELLAELADYRRHRQTVAPAPPAPASPEQRARLSASLAELETLLAENDTRASEAIKAIKTQLGDESGRALIRQIDLFDFEGALVTLRGLRASLAEAEDAP